MELWSNSEFWNDVSFEKEELTTATVGMDTELVEIVVSTFETDCVGDWNIVDINGVDRVRLILIFAGDELLDFEFFELF